MHKTYPHQTCRGVLRYALLVLLITGLSSSVFAASLTDRVQETYRKTESFGADFVQKTHIELLDRDIEEKGKLLFAKPGRFSIHYKGANERQYLSDGKTLWIYRPRDKEVEVIENVGDLIATEALVFLGGLGEMTKTFRVTEGENDQLILVPRGESSTLSKILLTIDSETMLVKEATLYPKSGNESHYSFSKTEVNKKVSSKDFVFSKKGIKEIRPLSQESS